MSESECHLTLVRYQDSQTCDGCGNEVIAGEFHIDGIESCCGGCYRILCLKCVKAVMALVGRGEHEQTKL